MSRKRRIEIQRSREKGPTKKKKNKMLKELDMLEFVTKDEAINRGGGKMPTTTKWVEGLEMAEDGTLFV